MNYHGFEIGDIVCRNRNYIGSDHGSSGGRDTKITYYTERGEVIKTSLNSVKVKWSASRNFMYHEPDKSLIIISKNKKFDLLSDKLFEL